MFIDSTMTFNSTFGTATSISATGTGTVFDVTGAGSGVLPKMVGGYPAKNTALGTDAGFGDGAAALWVVIQPTAAGTGSGTVTFYLESAPDNGSGSPGTYTKIWTSAAITGSLVTTTSPLLSFPLPPTGIEAPPRFYNMGWTVSGTVAETVLMDIVMNPTSGLMGAQYSNNFLVA